MTLNVIVKILDAENKVRQEKKHNQSKETSREDVLKYRKMINNENYMSNAIKEMAEEFAIYFQEGLYKAHNKTVPGRYILRRKAWTQWKS
jgi:hypothetical protein